MIEHKKQFTYRGKTLEELRDMDTREFAKYLSSNSRRAVLRQFDVIERFIAKCKKRKEQGKPIRTHLRPLVIVPKMVHHTINIHNGQQYISIKILPEMLGHRLGEFAITRKQPKHGAPGIGATRSSAAMSVK